MSCWILVIGDLCAVIPHCIETDNSPEFSFLLVPEIRHTLCCSADSRVRGTLRIFSKPRFSEMEGWLPTKLLHLVIPHDTQQSILHDRLAAVAF